MVNSVLGRAAGGRRGDITRASKDGVAIATSTLEAACTPPLTRPYDGTLRTDRRLPACSQRSWPSAEALRQRDDHACGLPDAVGAAQRSTVPRVGGLPSRAPVPLPAQAVWLQQARAAPRAADRCVHRSSRSRLAIVWRQSAIAGHHTGPVRTVARDDAALGAGRQRELRLLRRTFPPLLGISAVPAVRPGRHANPLRAVPGQPR